MLFKYLINTQLEPIYAPSDSDSLMKVDKNQLYQMMGQGEQDKAAANWARKSLKRDDLVLWFARAYKKDPNVFNEENRQNLEHYASMDHLPEINDLRLTKDHDFNSGIEEFRNAEQSGLDRLKKTGRMLPASGKKIVDAGDGYGWYSLGKNSCRGEGNAMGHCGNTASPHSEDDVLSLRKEHKFGDHVFHEPALTFINNNGHLGEMKGRSNDKPAPKYHDAIMKLLTSKEADIKKIVGGGHARDSNFNINDLSIENKQKLLEAKPDIDFHSTPDQIDPNKVPKKYKNEAIKHNANIIFANGIKDKSPKEVAKILADYNGKDWELSRKVADFMRSASFTKEHHDALMNSGASGAKLATKSPHVTDGDIVDLMRRKKGVGAYLKNELIYGHSHKLSEDQLQDMANHVGPASYSSVLHAMKRAKIAPSDELVNKMFATNPLTAKAVATFFPEKIKQEHADLLINHSNKFAHRALALSNVPYELKRDLISHPESETRACLAKSHSTPDHVLVQLSKDKNVRVRGSVASNKKPPKEAIDLLTGDRASSVRANILTNHGITTEQLNAALLHPKNRHNISAAARALGNPSSDANTLHHALDIHTRFPEYDRAKELARHTKRQASATHELAHLTEEQHQQSPWLRGRLEEKINTPFQYKPTAGLHIHDLERIIEHPHFNGSHAAVLTATPGFNETLDRAAAAQHVPWHQHAAERIKNKIAEVTAKHQLTAEPTKKSITELAEQLVKSLEHAIEKRSIYEQDR
jgi:hypothetical protein